MIGRDVACGGGNRWEGDGCPQKKQQINYRLLSNYMHVWVDVLGGPFLFRLSCMLAPPRTQSCMLAPPRTHPAVWRPGPTLFSSLLPLLVRVKRRIASFPRGGHVLHKVIPIKPVVIPGGADALGENVHLGLLYL